jgi:site-specific DNA-cytosine methylase
LRNVTHGGGQQRLDPETETLIPTIGGGFDVAHAFDARQSDVLQYGNLSGPLDTDSQSIGVLAFKSGQSEAAGGAFVTEDFAPTLQAQNNGSTAVPSVMAAMQVRRLTPRECARLQGFPDDYLDIAYRGKPAADGNKYKALGNSWAVPVARWVGQRIKQVEEACSSAKLAA